MKTYLAVFLCLSVLLSGCMTANRAISNPRPGSAAGGLLNMWGLVGDIGLAALIVFPTGYGTSGKEKMNPNPWWVGRMGGRQLCRTLRFSVRRVCSV